MGRPARCQEFEDLPPLLKNAWLLDSRLDFLNEEELKQSGITTSELCKRYLKYRLARYKKSAIDHTSRTPSLVAITAKKVRSMLLSSEDLNKEIEGLLCKNVEFPFLRHIFGSPETNYFLFRRFTAIVQILGGKGIQTNGQNLLDVDDMVLRNAKFLRSSVLRDKKTNDEKSDESLVTLAHLRDILEADPNDANETFEFRRKDPPKGGFEMLDTLRPRMLRIIHNDSAFMHAFNWATHNVLKCLDWANIFAAGPFIQTVLMLTEPSRPLQKRLGTDMIDLYIYRLDARQAMAKVEYIHDVWSTSRRGVQQLVTKHPCSITFSTGHRSVSVRIHTRLYRSCTHVLLGQDLDPLAVGWDGSQVLMLPRCARAFETGYSIFTTDLIHGDADLGRPPTLMSYRLSKLAIRGFGLRILPLYVLSLWSSGGFFRGRKESISTSKPLRPTNRAPEYEHAAAMTKPRYATAASPGGHPAPTHERYRKPAGDEPGLKTLKRIAFLGQNYIDRFFFNDAPRAKTMNQEQLGQRRIPRQDDASTRFVEGKPTWTAWEQARMTNEALLSEERWLHVPCAAVNWLSINQSNAYSANKEEFDRLGQFEGFMRRCEVLQLHLNGFVTVEEIIDLEEHNYLTAQDGIFSPYLLNEMANVPESRLRPSPHTRYTSDAVDMLGLNKFHRLQEGICDRLGIALQRIGYRDYLTRRIRLGLHGPDFQSVTTKHLIIPLTIPAELEDYIFEELLPSITDLPWTYARKRVMIPVHDPTKHPTSAPLPPLFDSPAKRGNLRYWMINHKTTWAGDHPIVDELFELFKAIHYCPAELRLAMLPDNAVYDPRQFDASDPDFILALAHMLRRRTVAPTASLGNNAALDGDLDPTEKMLFRAWVLSDPGRCDVSGTVETDMHGGGRNAPFDQDDYPNPPPEHLFSWHDDDKGPWPNSAFVPDWREIARVGMAAEEQRRDSRHRDDTDRHHDDDHYTQDPELGFTHKPISFASWPAFSGERTFASVAEDPDGDSDVEVLEGEQAVPEPEEEEEEEEDED